MTHQRPKIIHGGDLYTASRRYNIPEEDWIDLSTGLNPIAYPCEAIPLAAFSRLPYPKPEFKQAVVSYYGAHDYIPVSGTQEIIQHLPGRLAKLPVLLPSVGYQEHQTAWEAHDNQLNYYDASSFLLADKMIRSQLAKQARQHVLIINPNNPSGLSIPQENLIEWSNKLGRDARLIVDEAFIDLQPSASLLSRPQLPDNILVLRSCGKFFGLGGIRAGFLFGSESLLTQLNLAYNPWPINGPALHILSEALINRHWQQASRRRIQQSAKQLQALFSPLEKSLGSTNRLQLLANRGLFISYQGPSAYLNWLYDFFAEAGILLRLIAMDNVHSILRVGLIDYLDSTNIDRVRRCIGQLVSQSNFDTFTQNRPRTSILDRNK